MTRILAVTGSLCSGKSTLIEHTIAHSVLTGALGMNRAAYLLNDRPASDGRMVDGHAIREMARVLPFPNRCFTCEDTANLVRTLRAIESSGAVDIAFVEGFGFVAGHETADALRSTGYGFDIFTLVDARHLSENLATYGEVIRSQVAAATLGIGITHMENADLDATEAFIASASSPGVPVFRIARDHGVPPRLFARAAAFRQSIPQATGGCPCCSGHDHDGHHHEHHHDDHHGHDHHGHDHDHGHHRFHSATFPLRAAVRLEDLKTALGTTAFRAKGIVDGARFDMVHGEWTRSDRSDQPPIVTVYAHDDIVIPDHMVDRSMRQAPLASTKALLRSDAGIDPVLTERAIEKLASAIPADPIILPGAEGVRIAVQLEELQILKHISQRESVKGTWFIRAVSIALCYWIRCARYIADHADTMDATELPISKLEIGLSIGYWGRRFEHEIEHALLRDAASCDPARLLAEGLEASTGWMYSDQKRAIEQATYYRDVLDFAATRQDADRDALGDIEFRIYTAGLDEATRRGDAVLSAWQGIRTPACLPSIENPTLC